MNKAARKRKKKKNKGKERSNEASNDEERMSSYLYDEQIDGIRRAHDIRQNTFQDAALRRRGGGSGFRSGRGHRRQDGSGDGGSSHCGLPPTTYLM